MERAYGFLRPLTAFLLCLSFLFPAATVASNGAVFAYANSQGTDEQIVFALNVDKSTGDLFFHMSAPSTLSWVGVGVGSRMQGSTMFIAYKSQNDTGVTLSPRRATGHTEPSFDSSLVVEKLWDVPAGESNVVGHNSIKVDAVCRNCTAAMGSALDLESTSNQFIFALGPPFPFASDSTSAGLWEHQYYGRFEVDMTQATSESTGGVPQGPYTTRGATFESITTDNDPAQHIHGFIMSLVFILLLPLGSLLLRVWNKVKGHAIVQSIALVLFCMAAAGGCVLSLKFNSTKHFNNAHQILGMVLLLAMIGQWLLGFLNHRIFNRTGRSTIMGKIHRYFGPAIILVGLLNGGLGFQLAETPRLVLPYATVIVLMGIAFFTLRYFGTRCCGSRRRKNVGMADEAEGFRFPQFGPGGDRAPPTAANYPYPAPPPSYNASETRIPLQTYDSSTSVTHLPERPVEPRGMI